MTIEELIHVQLRPGLILIEPVMPHGSHGRILLPAMAHEQQPYGKVLLAPEGADLEPGDWVVYRRAKGYDIREWETDDKRAVSFVRSEDVVAVIQPDGLIPLGRNVILELPELRKETDCGILLANPREMLDEKYWLASVVEVAHGIDAVQVADKVVASPDLGWIEVVREDRIFAIVDVDELEAVIVGTD